MAFGRHPWWEPEPGKQGLSRGTESQMRCSRNSARETETETDIETDRERERETERRRERETERGGRLVSSFCPQIFGQYLPLAKLIQECRQQRTRESIVLWDTEQSTEGQEIHST